MDLFLDLVNAINKHGISWAALVAFLIAILKNREAILKLINRGKRQETQLDRIEHKLDALMIKEGVEWSAAETSYIASLERRLLISSRLGRLNAQSVRKFIMRGKRRMKSYLKKLGSRKFQAFLAVTIPNMIIMFGFILGDIDLEGQVNQWMPAINLVIQAITTATYQQAESKSDVASIKAEAIPPESVLTAVSDIEKSYHGE